jgi:hypothetical protein
MEFLLPQSVEYLGEKRGIGRTGNCPQGIGDRRYWDRITNEEIEPDQARDQVVLRDLHEWLRNRDLRSTLVSRIHEGGDYLKVWEHHAPSAFADDPTALLKLSEQILARLRTAHGSRASGENPREPFIVLWRCANRLVHHNAESREWLENQIREAMPNSLCLVLDLYYYWASPSSGIVRIEDREQIRRLIHELCKEQFHSGEDLIRVTHPEVQYDFYWLVYPPDGNEAPSALREVGDWRWLGPMLLDALRRKTLLFGLKIGHLISNRRTDDNAGHQVYHVVLETLTSLFGNNTDEVLLLLQEALASAEGQDRDFLEQVVRSAKTQQKGASTVP